MLMRKKYTPDINLYYQDSLPNELAEEIIRYIWLKQPPLEGEFELIREIRSKVYRMTFRDEAYYLKIYNSHNMSKIVKNMFRPADAVRYFQISLKLIQANITIAQPILALTKGKLFHPSESIFVTREVPGANLYTYLMENDQNDLDIRKILISQLAHIWKNLSTHNLAHHDPHLFNFIVSTGLHDQELQIKLIDVDNIYFRPLFPKKRLLVKNLQKFKWQLSRPDLSIPPSKFNQFWDEIRTNCEMLTK